jgi:hypothetical protein
VRAWAAATFVAASEASIPVTEAPNLDKDSDNRPAPQPTSRMANSERGVVDVGLSEKWEHNMFLMYLRQGENQVVRFLLHSDWIDLVQGPHRSSRIPPIRRKLRELLYFCCVDSRHGPAYNRACCNSYQLHEHL